MAAANWGSSLWVRGDGCAIGPFQTFSSTAVEAQQLLSLWALGLEFLLLGAVILPVALPTYSSKTELCEPSEKEQPKRHPNCISAPPYCPHSPNGCSRNVLLEVNLQLLFKYISLKKNKNQKNKKLSITVDKISFSHHELKMTADLKTWRCNLRSTTGWRPL